MLIARRSLQGRGGASSARACSRVPRAEPIRRAEPALKAFVECGVDLIMGRIHQSYAIETEVEGRSVLMVGAPTALSSRMRGEANGFWVIHAGAEAVECRLAGKDMRFHPSSRKVFPRPTKAE